LLETGQLLLERIAAVSLLVEGVASSGHYIVHYYSDCPHVHAFRVLVLERNFWRHVHQSSNVFIVTCFCQEVAFSEPKVDDFDRSEVFEVFEEDVCRLEISVDNALVMEIANSL
jgi:hypothetical protein